MENIRPSHNKDGSATQIVLLLFPLHDAVPTPVYDKLRDYLKIQNNWTTDLRKKFTNAVVNH